LIGLGDSPTELLRDPKVPVRGMLVNVYEMLYNVNLIGLQ
jgi:hypothetical protein